MAKSFFVVRNDSFFEGGAGFSLPTLSEDGSWTPGQWHSQKNYGEYSFIRESGFRVTHEPAAHWRENSECYEVECEGLLQAVHRAFLYSKVRLLRKLTEEDLVKYHILSSGSHTVRDGEVAITGSANVTLLGKAKALAYSASGYIEAHDCVEVVIYSQASRVAVNAYGRSKVSVHSSSVVIAYDEATAHAHNFGEFNVSIGGNSRLPKRLRKLSRISAYNNARIEIMNDSDIWLASPKASAKIVKTVPDYD